MVSRDWFFRVMHRNNKKWKWVRVCHDINGKVFNMLPKRFKLHIFILG